MSLLEDTLKAVREENLTTEQLEALRDTLIHLKTDISNQLAQKKKARALYLVTDVNASVAHMKRLFDATPDGQRLIELEGYLRGLGGEIESLTGRIFSSLGLHR